MLVYFVKRVLWAFLLLVALTLVTYIVFFQIPADPARFLVRNQVPTEEQLAEAREKLGVDEPIYVQYVRFVWRTLHLDLGTSYQSLAARRPEPVRNLLLNAAP